MYKSAFVLMLALLMAGCARTAGRDFAKPEAAKIELGKATKADILSMYGQPEQQSSAVVTETNLGSSNASKTEFDPAVVPGSYTTLAYRYSKSTPPIAGASFSARSLVFVFWNNVLVAYNFVSSFPNDSSNFDESKLSAIKKAQTTRADVFQLLGSPTGEAIYPAVQVKGTEKAIYDFAQIDMQKKDITSKRLELLFNSQGRVADYRFASNSRPMPIAAAAPAPTMYPIFIPSHK